MLWVPLVPRHRRVPPGRPASICPIGLGLRSSRHKNRHVQLRFAIGRDVATILGVQNGDRILITIGFPDPEDRGKSTIVKLERSEMGHVVNLRTMKARHFEVSVYTNRWGDPTIPPGLSSEMAWWSEGREVFASLPEWAIPARVPAGPSR